MRHRCRVIDDVGHETFFAFDGDASFEAELVNFCTGLPDGEDTRIGLFGDSDNFAIVRTLIRSAEDDEFRLVRRAKRGNGAAGCRP